MGLKVGPQPPVRWKWSQAGAECEVRTWEFQEQHNRSQQGRERALSSPIMASFMGPVPHLDKPGYTHVVSRGMLRKATTGRIGKSHQWGGNWRSRVVQPRVEKACCFKMLLSQSSDSYSWHLNHC